MDWRDILIVTGGSTPQVVTETLFGLLRRPRGVVVPAKIICVTTQGVAGAFADKFETALQNLIARFALKVNWRRSQQRWQDATSGLFVEFPRDDLGHPVKDIRSDADAMFFGNLISEIVRIETLHSSSRVHLSIAGGRRTMSFYGGAAMSLFGRPQDELSHVLVDPPAFEKCSEFWFPSAERSLVKHENGSLLDASIATIRLTHIPFLRVRDRLPQPLLERAVDYATHVAHANASLGDAPLPLKLITSERRVSIGDLASFSLPNTEFALYQLMAEWRVHHNKGASEKGVGETEAGWLTARMFRYPEEYRPNPVTRFLDIYADTFKTSSEQAADMSNTITAKPANETQRKANERSFAQWKARLVKALRQQLHQAELANRFGAPRAPIRVPAELDGHKFVVFGLKIDPGDITIELG